MEESKTGWLTLIVVTLSVFIIVIDKTFLNVAISTLIRDLNTNIATIQSIIAIYSLIMASLMIPGGKLQDVLGRRKTFLLGAFIYGVGAVIAAASVNSVMLLIGWSVLEGVGAALMMPATTSIISGSYSGERRAFALGIISSMASGAGTIGPIIGGFLTAYYSWRYAFALELVVILVIFLLSREISTFPPTLKWSKFDLTGALFSASGIFLLVEGILLLNDPKTWTLTPFFIVAGIILLVIFYFNQQKKINDEDKSPLLDITLFKNLAFTLGNLARLIMNFIIGGVLFVIPVFIQLVLGTDPLTTGLALIPMSLGIFTLSFTAGKVSTRFKARYILSVGFLASMAGSIYLSLIFSPYTTILDMMPGILLLGIGMGIVFPHSANVIFAMASRNQQPDASGVMNTGINLGSAMGTAVLGVILILGGFSSLEMGNGGLTPSYQVQLKDIPGKLGIGPNALNEVSVAPTPANLRKINTMKYAFNVITIVLLIGLISSILIPPRKKIPEIDAGGVNSYI